MGMKSLNWKWFILRVEEIKPNIFHIIISHILHQYIVLTQRPLTLESLTNVTALVLPKHYTTVTGASISRTRCAWSGAVIMTSLVPACYFITVKQQRPLDGGLPPSWATHLAHVIRLSSCTLGLKLARLRTLGALCLRELPCDIRGGSAALRRVALCYDSARPFLEPLAGMYCGNCRNRSWFSAAAVCSKHL